MQGGCSMDGAGPEIDESASTRIANQGSVQKETQTSEATPITRQRTQPRTTTIHVDFTSYSACVNVNSRLEGSHISALVSYFPTIPKMIFFLIVSSLSIVEFLLPSILPTLARLYWKLRNPIGQLS